MASTVEFTALEKKVIEQTQVLRDLRERRKNEADRRKREREEREKNPSAPPKPSSKDAAGMNGQEDELAKIDKETQVLLSPLLTFPARREFFEVSDGMLKAYNFGCLTVFTIVECTG